MNSVQPKVISFRGDILPLKNALYRLALRITLSHEDAEDVVQDTMLKLWNKREQWPQIENIEAFAMTVCRNIALDKLKNAHQANISLEEKGEYKGQEEMVAAAWMPVSAQQNPYQRTAERDGLDMARRIINSLPEKQRSCMQLRDIEGKSYKEIAAILEISEEQVKVNIYRARQTVKQRYQEFQEYGL